MALDGHLDGLHGTIIGPFLRHFRLYSPTGEELETADFETMKEATDWAIDRRTSLIAEVGEREARRLGWWGKGFELREMI